MTPDSQKTILRSRPQASNFRATAGQGAVTREAAACRNRLLTRYPSLGIGYRRRMKLFETKVLLWRLLFADRAARGFGIHFDSGEMYAKSVFHAFQTELTPENSASE